MSLLTRGIELSTPTGWPRGVMVAGRPVGVTGWEQGIEFRGLGCQQPVVSAQCVTFDDTPAGADVATFTPFTLRQSAICSTLSQSLGTTALDRLNTATEWALGNELATGTVTGNPSLSDATSSTTAAVTIVDALSCLLADAADAGYGTPVTLHANARALPHLADLDYDLSIDRLIVSPGYPNTDARLWATGPVWWAVSAAQELDSVDWRRNSLEDWAQREALAVFDPCLNLTADFDVAAC